MYLAMENSFIKPYCAVCLLDLALKYLQESTTDEAKIMEGMRRAIDILQRGFSTEAFTFQLGTEIASMISSYLEIDDIFATIKRESNEICEAMFPDLVARYNSIDDFDAKLDFVLCVAVAGNIIDVNTPGHEFTLDATYLFKIIKEIHLAGFEINDKEQLKALIFDDAVVKFLIMLDNAGEIVFDKLLVMFLKEYGKQVTCMVKGKPISNDVTRVDAEAVGIDVLCDDILETSDASIGYDINHNNQDVIDKVNATDVIIGKGQANLETLSTFIDDIQARHIFILSRIKCQTIAAFECAKIGQQIIRKIK